MTPQMKKILVWGIFGLVLFMIASSGCGSYNNMVTMDEGVTAQWQQVENQYQRRMDLIPNLVNTVQGYADFEKSTIIAVTEARASVGQVKIDPAHLDQASIQKFQQAQDNLGSAVSRLLVVAEKYPELKANQNFLELQAQLEGTENRITTARKDYNDAVYSYNLKVRRFPGNIAAGFFGFTAMKQFESTKGAETAPKVDFETTSS